MLDDRTPCQPLAGFTRVTRHPSLCRPTVERCIQNRRFSTERRMNKQLSLDLLFLQNSISLEILSCCVVIHAVRLCTTPHHRPCWPIQISLSYQDHRSNLDLFLIKQRYNLVVPFKTCNKCTISASWRRLGSPLPRKRNKYLGPLWHASLGRRSASMSNIKFSPPQLIAQHILNKDMRKSRVQAVSFDSPYQR